MYIMTSESGQASPTTVVGLKRKDIILRINQPFASDSLDDLLVCGDDDFTFLLTSGQVMQALYDGSVVGHGVPTLPQDAFTSGSVIGTLTLKECEHWLKTSIDASLRFVCTGWPSLPDFTWSGRACLAACYNKKFYSVTVRKENIHGLNTVKKYNAFKKALRAMPPTSRIARKNQMVPEPITLDSKSYQFKEFLYGFGEVCRALAKHCFDGGNKTGLLVVSGATGCGKSQITRGLIWEYLQKINVSKRRPHVIDVEDPIEKLFWPGHKTSNRVEVWNAAARVRGFDYTPRKLRLDVDSLQQALLDAKRMTPSLVFIGETRSKADWAKLVDFAGSGHFVVTTTHAGSLVETLQRICKAVKAETPAERGNIARSLLAVIHLQSFSIPSPCSAFKPSSGLPESRTFNAILPALWTFEHGGGANLVADGFASVVPNNNDFNSRGCLGRSWFVSAIEHELENYLSSLPSKTKKTRFEQALKNVKSFWRDLEIQSLQSDLKAL